MKLLALFGSRPKRFAAILLLAEVSVFCTCWVWDAFHPRYGATVLVGIKQDGMNIIAGEGENYFHAAAEACGTHDWSIKKRLLVGDLKDIKNVSSQIQDQIHGSNDKYLTKWYDVTVIDPDAQVAADRVERMAAAVQKAVEETAERHDLRRRNDLFNEWKMEAKQARDAGDLLRAAAMEISMAVEWMKPNCRMSLMDVFEKAPRPSPKVHSFQSLLLHGLPLSLAILGSFSLPKRQTPHLLPIA